jgi:prepilin-type N-terminal cleavage/methylation domain-containing protein
VIPPQAQTRSSQRHGLTLLELIVVLVLLGVAAAVVAPMLRRPTVKADASTPLERARALAVRRGEVLRLHSQGAGSWVVTAVSDTSEAILLSGLGDSPAFPVLITALGVCQPEGVFEGGMPPWDPASCAPARR